METESLELIVVVAWAAAGLLLVSLGLVLIRLIRGPSLAERVVALDLITLLAIAFAGAASIAMSQPVLLDVGLALALVAFLATLAFAWYLERQAERGLVEGAQLEEEG